MSLATTSIVDQRAFQATLTFLRDAREKRGERMIQQLRDQGINVEWSRVRELAKGTVGRPHVALALIEAGYAADVSDAFARYLTRGKAGYVPRFKLAPEQAIQLIRSAQGVPVLAHPAGITGLAETVLPTLVGQVCSVWSATMASTTTRQLRGCSRSPASTV